MQAAINPDSVVRFLNHFEEVAMQKDAALLSDMIDERACCRFNDGDSVGREALQVAFEKIWRADPTVKKARSYRSDIVVLSTDQCCLGRFPKLP